MEKSKFVLKHCFVIFETKDKSFLKKKKKKKKKSIELLEKCWNQSITLGGDYVGK